MEDVEIRVRKVEGRVSMIKLCVVLGNSWSIFINVSLEPLHGVPPR